MRALKTGRKLTIGGGLAQGETHFLAGDQLIMCDVTMGKGGSND